MFINKDPKDKVYNNLLNIAFDVCDEFMFVVKKPPHFDEPGENILNLIKDLEPYLREYREQFYWPGTYFSSEATVYYYNTAKEAKEIIKKYSKSLHTWLQPDLPEDLCFVKNGESWLVNTSHERCSYIYTEEQEEIKRLIVAGVVLIDD